MQRQKLLSIGEMSKMTGVHVKSLRYYDRIGVLKPVYVDPDTSYRYYTYPQLGIVDAIQTCVELEIPLKQFPDFVEDGGQEIHYARLLEHGKKLAEEKIRGIRDGLKQIELKSQRVLTLPAGRYISKCVGQRKIETAPEEFPEQFANDFEQIVVESELFTGDSSISKPVYELRCSTSELHFKRKEK